MKQIIQKSLQDILSKEVIFFVLKVGFGSILLWIILLWISWDLYAGVISAYIQKIPFIGSWEWFQSSGAFLTALIIGYMLIIITISILTSLYSEPLLIKLAQKHYSHVTVKGSPKITTSIILSIKAGLVFLLLFLFTFPLIFIPILGQIWMLWLWSILIKEPTAYDVASLFTAEKKKGKEKTKSSVAIAMIASLFNYIPVLNIFAPVFAQILFLHHILGEKSH